MVEIKIFSKYDPNVEVKDISLKDYINIDPVIVPRSGGKFQKNPFWKNKASIVERLMNKITVSGHKGKDHFRTSGHNTGKAHLAYNNVKKAFDLIFEKTKKNPLEVLIRAIEKCSPYEETTAIEMGGVRYPKSVDVSPQRRIDMVLGFIAQGAYSKSFKKKTTFPQALANEIMFSAEGGKDSLAFSKKEEKERVAEGSR